MAPRGKRGDVQECLRARPGCRGPGVCSWGGCRGSGAPGAGRGNHGNRGYPGKGALPAGGQPKAHEAPLHRRLLWHPISQRGALSWGASGAAQLVRRGQTALNAVEPRDRPKPQKHGGRGLQSALSQGLGRPALPRRDCSPGAHLHFP